MSGIGAILYRDGRPAQRGEIERVARALTMYGPERVLVRMAGPIAFAYSHFTNTPEARGAYQPVAGGDGRYMLLFDGRLDNRSELGGYLSLDADYLRELSDAALAMRCWERWQVDAFNRWIGEFSTIVWDNSEARLISASHQFGYRTLYYHLNNSRLVIASAPKGIHALGDLPRELDEQRIADALCQAETDCQRSFYKGINRIPAAHILIADRSKCETRKYYEFVDHITQVRYNSDDEYVEAASELLESSVNAMLRSPGPVGSFMSGGLDSSTVAVIASRELSKQGKRLPVFTWVPEEGWDGLSEPHCYGDETPYVEAIADRHPSIETNFINAAGRTHYYKQDLLLHGVETPLRNAVNTSWAHSILEAARSRGIKVMLDGTQGNATLSYRGEGVFTDLWRRGSYHQLAREIRYEGSGSITFLRNAYLRLVDPLGPNWLWRLKERVRGRSYGEDRWLDYVTVNPEFGRAMRIPERIAESGDDFFGQPLARSRDYWTRVLTSSNISILGDWLQGMIALYGVEIRDPFSDRRVLEWSLGVPEDQFHRNGVGRWLIKRMMSGVLPDKVLFKPRDTGDQYSDWHLRMGRELPQMRADLEQMATDPDLARMIDIERLRKMLDDWPEKTIVDYKDNRRFYLPVNLPMALQIGRFIQLIKGTNYDSDGRVQSVERND